MPSVRLESSNQCFADGSSAEEELALSSPSAPQPTQAFGGTDGAEGAPNAGSEALLQRFTESGKGDSCPPEELTTLAACAAMVLVSETPAVIVAAVNCAGAVAALDRCYTDD